MTECFLRALLITLLLVSFFFFFLNFFLLDLSEDLDFSYDPPNNLEVFLYHVGLFFLFRRCFVVSSVSGCLTALKVYQLTFLDCLFVSEVIS